MYCNILEVKNKLLQYFFLKNKLLQYFLAQNKYIAIQLLQYIAIK